MIEFLGGLHGDRVAFFIKTWLDLILVKEGQRILRLGPLISHLAFLLIHIQIL